LNAIALVVLFGSISFAIMNFGHLNKFAVRPKMGQTVDKVYSIGNWITESHFSGSSWFQAPSM
jgi:hypothetical protein